MLMLKAAGAWEGALSGSQNYSVQYKFPKPHTKLWPDVKNATNSLALALAHIVLDFMSWVCESLKFDPVTCKLGSSLLHFTCKEFTWIVTYSLILIFFLL